ncbi:sensor histidine kinase [Patescibacteria group bacterium]
MINFIDFSIKTLFLYLVVLNFLLAFFIIFRNPKKRINQSFSLLLFTLSLWIFSLFASQYFGQNLLLWSKLSLITQLIIVLDVLYISFVYPKKQELLNGAALVFGTAYFLVFSFLFLFSSIWVGILDSFTKGYLIFITISIIPISWTILNLYQKFPKTIGLEKQQLKYVFWAYIFWAFTANILAGLFNISGNSLAYLSFCFLSSLVLSIAIFYAIARYRLLDIRFLVSKAIIYGLLAIIIVIFYTFCLFVVGLYFYEAQLTNINLLITLSLTVIISLTIVPIKKTLEKLTNRAILKDKISQNLALSQLNSLFLSSTDLKSLANDFSLTLQETLKLESAIFVFIKQGKTQIFPEQTKLNIDLNQLENIIQAKEKVILFDNLQEGANKNLLRELKVYYVYTYLTNEFSAILLLGFKSNGDIYFEDETNFLNQVIPQFLNTLEKILIYEKLKDFNAALTIKVEEATSSLKTINQDLKKALQLKEELISVVAHELSVPMVAISSSIAAVMEGLTGKIPKSSKEFLQAIYNENTRLIRLTKNLLYISRIKSKRVAYELEKFNPKDLVNEAVELMKPLAEEKNLKLFLEAKNKDIKVLADRDKLKEVLINLIDNSIRYTKTGQIKVGYIMEKEKIQFFVEDTGIGMAPNLQQKLFYGVDLLNAKRTLDKQGRGLGLYISYNLLQGMKGKIAVKSQEKKGSKFMFWLPMV